MRAEKHTYFALFAASAFLFVCASCSNTGSAVPDGAKIEGESLIIELEENPTTGFSWKCDEYDTSILELLEDEYLPASVETDIVGSSGIHHYAFKGLSEGETTLTFKYIKAWEGDESAEDTRTFKVVVDQEGAIESIK